MPLGAPKYFYNHTYVYTYIIKYVQYCVAKDTYMISHNFLYCTMYKSFREKIPDSSSAIKINAMINFIEAFDGEDVFSTTTTNSTNSIVNSAEVESLATRKRKKQESINNYASLMTQLAMKNELYDLPGMPSFFTIQNFNKEYFTYDPRGDRNIRNTLLPIPYCKLCLCPSQYCCDVVIGPIVVTHTETLIYNQKSRNTMNLHEVTAIFRKVYSEVVNAKMIFNKKIFKMELDKRVAYPVPKCVARGSLKKILIVFTVDIQKNE